MWYFLFLCVALSHAAPKVSRIGRTALDNVPLIDGHNDFPYNLYSLLGNQLGNLSFDSDLKTHPLFGTANCDSCFTDLPRIREGKLGAQFWVAYVGCNPNNYDTIVSRSYEQIDVIKRLIAKYPDDLEFVTTADGITQAFQNKKLASLIGLEGGHSIDSKMALLRLFYELGVRYMTLTHSCNLPWADASPVDNVDVAFVANLTDFGKKIVLEMNRLGMMVDLSHVSHNVMSEALDVTKAPVIFSHSSAYAVYPHHRNVRDDILLKVRDNDGIVMVNFYTGFVARNATLDDVVAHINHIVNVAGVDHVGIGADYDGVDSVPVGLEDVSKYPDLFDRLQELDPVLWTVENLQKLAGENFLRVFHRVEEVRDELANEGADDSLIVIVEEPPKEEENEDPPNDNGGSNKSVTLVTSLTLTLTLGMIILSQ